MLPTADTVVTYPTGAVASTGTVIHVEPLSGARTGVFLDTTACHPVDAAWPDQPADRGTLVVNGVTFDIVDCVVGATDGTALYLGADVPVRKGTEGWAFVVAHIIEGAAVEGSAVEGAVVEGATAQVRADADYRRALSAGHTACHLASLALNAQLTSAWTKEVQFDGLGHPNFDGIAIETSTIGAYGSVDVYRIGKSLRKRGFTPAALDDLAAVADGANSLLAQWVTSAAEVTIAREGEGLTSRREWRCALPGHLVSIPCGGTHLASLAELASVTVSLATEEIVGAVEVRMSTTATTS
jgi:alanyl-tRNA synthetase